MSERKKARPVWQYDELKINSVMDYSMASQAAQYEERHGQVRNIAAENAQILERLEKLIPGGLASARLLEIGTGTGAFARTAAPRCAQVTALDASQAMLDVAREKMEPLALTNVELIQAGFLTFDFPENAYDAVVSSLALHHLPDVWKGEALANIFRTLKPGGVLVLVDVMFACEGGEMANYVPTLATPDLGEVMQTALIGHIAQEFSTFSWIMNAIVEHSGLKILEHQKFNQVTEIIVARKP